jgi:hypothetical protein
LKFVEEPVIETETRASILAEVERAEGYSNPNYAALLIALRNRDITDEQLTEAVGPAKAKLILSRAERMFPEDGVGHKQMRVTF